MSAYIPLAPYYDQLTRDVPYEAFADFYEKVFERYAVKPKTVLDLACGTGTLTVLLAGRGYEMIGADASGEMLSQAMEKVWQAGDITPPMFLNQSMEELDLYGTVNAAVCSLDGINYVPPELLPEVFDRLSLFVEPGGVIIFDINTPEKLMGQDGEVFIDETEDVFCVWRAEFSPEDGACVYGIDLFLDTGDVYIRRQEEHVEYAHTRKLIAETLCNAGFGEISVYGDFSMAEPTGGEDRLFFAARRI